MDSSQMA